jgi:hypothetical protein
VRVRPKVGRYDLRQATRCSAYCKADTLQQPKPITSDFQWRTQERRHTFQSSMTDCRVPLPDKYNLHNLRHLQVDTSYFQSTPGLDEYLLCTSRTLSISQPPTLLSDDFCHTVRCAAPELRGKLTSAWRPSKRVAACKTYHGGNAVVTQSELPSSIARVGDNWDIAINFYVNAIMTLRFCEKYASDIFNLGYKV